MTAKKIWAVGLMSGTSMDAMDAALVRTNGEQVGEGAGYVSLPYGEGERQVLEEAVARGEKTPSAAALITEWGENAARAVVTQAGMKIEDVGVVGFHGHTVFHQGWGHDGAGGRTEQAGDARELAQRLGVWVAGDFRTHDVAQGGQGAPLAPLYHWLRVQSEGLKVPVGVVNVGGVANLTWVGGGAMEEVMGFDVGPGNGMVDTWMWQNAGVRWDEDGERARSGVEDKQVVEAFLAQEYFARPPPKSLDRFAFNMGCVAGKTLEDGAATLVGCAVGGIRRGVELLAGLGRPLSHVLVSGGGRHNGWLMERLAQAVAMPVRRVEEVGWNGDALEAEAFAVFGVRVVRGLPLTWPALTGVGAVSTGGQIWDEGGNSRGGLGSAGGGGGSAR